MGVAVTLRGVTPVTLVTRKRPSWPPLDLVKYPATPPLAGRSGQPGSRLLRLIVEGLEQTQCTAIPGTSSLQPTDLRLNLGLVSSEPVPVRPLTPRPTESLPHPLQVKATLPLWPHLYQGVMSRASLPTLLSELPTIPHLPTIETFEDTKAPPQVATLVKESGACQPHPAEVRQAQTE